MAWSKVSNLKGPQGDPGDAGPQGDPGPGITVWDADESAEPADAVPGDVWMVTMLPQADPPVLTRVWDPQNSSVDINNGDTVEATNIGMKGTGTYGLKVHRYNYGEPDGTYSVSSSGTWTTTKLYDPGTYSFTLTQGGDDGDGTSESEATEPFVVTVVAPSGG